MTPRPTPPVERPSSRFLAPLVFALALAVAAGVIGTSLPGANLDPDSDDGYYLMYMQEIQGRGLSAFPGLFDEWNRVPENWDYPPPSRIGFIAATALWGALFGPTMAALQWFSCTAHVLGAVVNYLFARRHLGEPKALFAGVLWSFSPLLMGLARQPLTDSLIALCMSLSVWLLLELVEAPASRPRRILFMAALAFMVLVKELSVLLTVPFVAFVLIERYWRREPLDLWAFALTFALPGVVAGAIFVLAAGGPRDLLETTRIVLESPASNDYAVKFGAGPWFRYLIDYLCLSPATTLLAIAFAGVLALRLRGGDYDRALVFLGLLAALFLFELGFFTKNVRYGVALELPLQDLCRVHAERAPRARGAGRCRRCSVAGRSRSCAGSTGRASSCTGPRTPDTTRTPTSCWASGT